MTWFTRIHLLALPLCFAIVVFGAFVRLSDAGLGCPDWPGCYGQLTVTAAQAHAGEGGGTYAQRPLEAAKAWKEMIHRYLVGMLGLCVVALVVLGLLHRDAVPPAFPLGLLALIVFQALLGMWTVTLQLKPLVVTGHLLGGLATLSLVYWMWLRLHVRPAPGRAPALAPGWTALALVLLVAQIVLGGWTSSNYAAAACPAFPTCQGQGWPPTDYAAAFSLAHPTGINYEYGVLDSVARVTIHWTHRLGAATLTAVLGALSLRLLLAPRAGPWRRLGALLLGALALQLIIGISLIELHFPLWLGDAHTAGAAVLLLATITVTHWMWSRPPHP